MVKYPDIYNQQKHFCKDIVFTLSPIEITIYSSNNLLQIT